MALICAGTLLGTVLFDFYATEARSYSVEVACIAFAMVCYQQIGEQNDAGGIVLAGVDNQTARLVSMRSASGRRALQRLGSTSLFAGSVVLAEAFHYYAVFAMVLFGVAELARSVIARRVRWAAWTAPACGTLPMMIGWQHAPDVNFHGGIDKR